MSALRLVSVFFLATAFFFGCAKDDHSTVLQPEQKQQAATGFAPTLGSVARYAGADYSQSISIGDANSMINSYLTSVNYPNYDTALRSLTFDADTLRAYLRDTSIVTLKFFIAHTPAYTNNPTTYGRYAGMKADAITLVIAGVNNIDGYVRSTRNGFYEHAKPCPADCLNGAGAYLE